MKIIVRKPTSKETILASTWPIWTKRVSRFPWHYDEKETCLILEGEATVTTDNGKVNFKSGDFIIFPKGLDCVWRITRKIKKHYKFD